MSVPFVVVTVDHTPGGRLPNGMPNGVGGITRFGIALTTNGIDRQEVVPPSLGIKEAHRRARQLEAELRQEA